MKRSARGSVGVRLRETAFVGVATLALSEVFGLACGLAMHTAAARGLAAADYGRFTVLLILGICWPIPVNAGVPQGLRAIVSADHAQLSHAVRWVVTAQLPISLGTGLLLALMAGPIARALGDSALVEPIRWIAVDVAVQCGLMEPALALLNGLRR